MPTILSQMAPGNLNCMTCNLNILWVTNTWLMLGSLIIIIDMTLYR